MYSRTMKSEMDQPNLPPTGPQITGHSRENTRNNLSVSRQGSQPNVLREQKLEQNIVQMATMYKATLVVLFHFFEVEIPPVENLEDQRWSGFINKLKKKFADMINKADASKDACDNYKQMLDEKCIE